MFHDDLEPMEPEYDRLLPQQENPGEPGFYETGHIDPPRNYAGVVAIMLLVLIFCGGLAGGMLLNLHMGAPDSAREDGAEATALLSSLANQPPEVREAEAPTEPVPDRSLAAAGPALVIHETPEAVPSQTQEGALSLQEIYRRVSPSVVSITAVGSSNASTGTGIIMSQSGYIITNCHVVAGAERLTVILADGSEYAAELVGRDSLSDLAVLRVDAPGLVAAEFGDSDSVQVGDSVSAIGDPLGIELRGTFTNGIVSAINRNLSFQGRTLTLIQTTAALNEGNSGGPLINCYGQVVGINTIKIGDYYSSAGVEGLGFAIPINQAKEVVDQLIALGHVPGRPSLGVETTVLSYEYQLWYGLPEGLYITDVPRDSEAWETGLRTGDVILYVDDCRITDEADLTAALADYEAGDQVSIVIYRSRRQYEGTIRLREAWE